MHAGQWERGKFIGTEVCSKTLGVVGLGNIGRIVADRALGLKMKVIGYDPMLTARGGGADRRRAGDAGPALPARRFHHRPHAADPRHATLVGAAAFAMMKKGVRIINCARGGIVDEPALAEAIASGKVAGAALDVFVEEPPPPDHPLLKLDKVIATPHLGAATDEAQVQVAIDIAQQIVEFLLNGAISQAVNIPALSPKELEMLGPHLRLGERLGRLAAQLIAEPPVQVTVGLGGEAAGLKAEPITAAVLKGLLSGFLDQEFNYVNAPFIARERGIAVTETRSRETTDYINTLTLTVRTPSGVHEVAGAVHRQPRPAAHPHRRLPGRGGARGLLPDAAQPRRAGRGRRGGHDAGAGGDQYRRAGAGPRSRRRDGAQPGRGRRPGPGRGARASSRPCPRSPRPRCSNSEMRAHGIPDAA